VASASQRTYVATFVLASTLFAACAVAALAWEEGAELDVRLVRWVHRNAPAALVDVMRVLTYLGSAGVLGPLALGAALLLAWRGLARAGVFVLTAFVASEALDQLLKELFRRARPSLEDSFQRLATYSFPSGHAFASTATYGALALVVAAAIPRARRALVVAGTAVLVALVAASRVVLGVHYLLDVLAGIAAGIALLSALLLAFRGRVVEVAVDARGNEQPERARLDP
jgi:undecaprenyl-diphosphatase